MLDNLLNNVGLEIREITTELHMQMKIWDCPLKQNVYTNGNGFRIKYNCINYKKFFNHWFTFAQNLKALSQLKPLQLFPVIFQRLDTEIWKQFNWSTWKKQIFTTINTSYVSYFLIVIFIFLCPQF